MEGKKRGKGETADHVPRYRGTRYIHPDLPKVGTP